MTPFSNSFAPALLLPEDGANFSAYSDIALLATNSIGSPTNLIFLSGTTNGFVKLGQAASAPYSCTWTEVPPGDYTLRVCALGENGHAGFSAPVSITVHAAPEPPSTNAPPVAMDDEVSLP